LAKAKKPFRAIKNKALLENATAFNDSISYDTGIDFPDDFVGIEDPAVTIATAVKFDAENDFELTAVRNAYRTETATDVEIILEIYRGGATPADGELLLQQITSTLSPDGIFALEELDTPLNFNAGESFWVVHKYPNTIIFPQGVDTNTASVRPDTYFFSTDGGATYANLTNFIFLTRALSSNTSLGYLTLEPSSGSVAPGESLDVQATFNAALLANGNYNRDIIIDSNDPAMATTIVSTSLDVTGQVSEIEVSDELVLFNDVFLGNNRERTFTITNSGIGILNVTSITSDTADFFYTKCNWKHQWFNNCRK